MVRISLIVLLCAVFLFADDVPDEGSLYWGGRLSLLAGSAWNDKSVKGVFSPTYKYIEESNMVKNSDLGFEVGALCWFRFNRFIGLEGETNIRITGFTLENRIYNRPLDGEQDAENDVSFHVWNFNTPLLVRVMPTRSIYVEAGAQFNLNLGGSIENEDDSFDVDIEKVGWGLAFGAGALSYLPRQRLLWSAGTRVAIDMTRIEKEGIVEIRKGSAYRESSPLKLFNIQLNGSFYF